MVGWMGERGGAVVNGGVGRKDSTEGGESDIKSGH